MRWVAPWARVALLLAGPLLLPAPAIALVFSVEGTVTALLDYPPVGISVSLGDPVTGTFTIDPATASCAPGGACGRYSFAVGGIELFGTFEDALVIDGAPPSQDSLFVLDEDAPVPGFPCSGVCLLVLEFHAPGGTTLTSGSLEAALLALPTWPGTLILDAGDFTTFQEIRVTLTSVTQLPDASPVPALPLAWVLVPVLGAAGLAALRRGRET